MIDQVPVSYYLLLSAVLFTIGAGGVLIRRNAIVILMCVEIMMNAVNLTFIAFSRYLDSATGQIFVFMIMAVAAVEVAVGLALLVELNRHKEAANIDQINSLKG
jgi:NADH-quinone oxidoreductase subunit K